MSASPIEVGPPYRGKLALAMSGGGARAAYQVGFLRYLAREIPGFRADILTGVSAGAINAAFIASREGTVARRVEELSDVWCGLTVERVFNVDALELMGKVLRWGARLVSGGAKGPLPTRGLVDTTPLRELLQVELRASESGDLPGIDENLARGDFKAIALTTTSYTTGQSITWIQGRDVRTWRRPNRKSVLARLTVDHVMASAALPFFFPAVPLDGGWYGDGGVRLAAPLSPAIHLGADKIVAIATRHAERAENADAAAVEGYPPPAQVAGVLLNAIFLDLMDQDALRLEQFNRLLSSLPSSERGSMRHIDLLVLRPSQDLGILANEYELRLPRAFRFLVRGLGTRKARSNDMLSLLMFQPDYLRRLVELGEEDARRHSVEVLAFLDRRPGVTASQ